MNPDEWALVPLHQETSASVTSNTPIKSRIDTAATPSTSQSLVKHAMARDLPKFKILDDNMKDSEDAFVFINQYFAAFERTFRMKNVDLEYNWRDSLASVIGIDHADWYSDTIEQNIGVSYI